MRNGANAVFTFIKSILLQCDTASNKKIHIGQSREDAGVMVASEDGKSNRGAFVCISENKTNITLLTECNDESSLVDGLDLKDMNVETSAGIDAIRESSLNMPRATFQDLIEDVKIQLILEMRTMIEENKEEMKHRKEENRNEMKGMNDENRKETKSLIEENRQELSSMMGDLKKEITRLDGNFKNLNKRVKTGMKEGANF